jgi:hypothetical protein
VGAQGVCCADVSWDLGRGQLGGGGHALLPIEGARTFRGVSGFEGAFHV